MSLKTSLSDNVDLGLIRNDAPGEFVAMTATGGSDVSAPSFTWSN